MIPSQKYVRNRLLAALGAADYAVLQDVVELVPLKRGIVVVEPNQPLTHVFFVEAGIVSLVANTPEGRRIEIGLVGREGFVGVPVLLGVDQTPQEALVQAGGEALRLPAASFRELLQAHPGIAPALLRYTHVFQVQTAQTALSNGSYNMVERLARWLLMCHDRVDGDEFPFTHEFLAIMLGVHRPGVTTTVHILEGAGMIKARRSHIQIVSRAKLEDAAGDSYGVPEAEYRRLIGSATSIDKGAFGQRA